MAALVVSLVLSWVAIAVMAIALIGLARQVGVLHERIAPLGALRTDSGPAIGEAAPKFSLLALDQRRVEIGRPALGIRAQLLMFVSPVCPICKQIIPTAKAFSADERLEMVLIGDGAEDEYQRMVKRFALESFAFVNSSDVGIRYGVGKLPYAVLINERGVMVGAGLVNSREHLDSLVMALESGHRSVQDYLRQLSAQGTVTPVVGAGAGAKS